MKTTLRALVGLSLVALAVVGLAFGVATPGAFQPPAAGDLSLGSNSWHASRTVEVKTARYARHTT